MNEIMLTTINLFDKIRYSNTKNIEIPYEITSQKEGFYNDKFHFKKHPNKIYAENFLVHSLVNSSGKFEMHHILDSSFNALITEGFDYITALEIINKMITNVKTETGSSGREFGYYLFKLNPIFVLTPLIMNTIYRKDTLKRKLTYEFTEFWINTKVNEFTKLNKISSIKKPNVLSQFELVEDKTILVPENNIINCVKFTKLEAFLPKKTMIRIFKNHINEYIGLDEIRIEEFINYCFYFDYKNRKQYKTQQFNVQKSNSTFFYELLKKLYPKETSVNICRLLSTCFDNDINKGFDLHYLQTQIAYKNKYCKSPEFNTIIDIIKSRIKSK